MFEFALAYLTFLVLHDRRLRLRLRERLAPHLGEAGAGWSYSLLSFAVLFWVLRAAGTAPYLELWAPALWQHHLALALMPLALTLIALGSVRANPFSLSFSSRPFDPGTPRILVLTRHPILLGIALWALAHLPPNGDAVHVFLFASYALFAAFGAVALDRLRRRQMPEAEWRRLAAATALFAPWRLGRALRGWERREALALAAALALYLAFVAGLHGWLFGVAPVIRG